MWNVSDISNSVDVKHFYITSDSWDMVWWVSAVLVVLAALCRVTAVAATLASPPPPYVALAPLNNCSKLSHNVCYQGPLAAIQKVATGDPLACHPPSAHIVAQCAAAGFTSHVGSDPVFTDVELWLRKDPPTHENETMTLCGDKCESDCKVYSPPTGECYSPPVLWPGDPQWGASDTLDLCNHTHIVRSFFTSTNGSCANQTDEFTLPLDVCVGPFGKPRPWGKFACKRPTL